MKKTIYVVTSGAYSDYGIESMFSTKEKAEAYREQFDIQTNYDHADIEEWVLDEDDNKVAGVLYRSKINIATGAITQQWDYKTLFPKGSRADSPQFIGQTEICVGSYESREHSLKLAAEARQKYLREQDLPQ